MANVALLNRMARASYWKNRGFAEGLEGSPKYPNVPEKFQAEYDAQYAQGRRYAGNLELDRLNGEFS